MPFISLVIKISIYEPTCHMFEDRVHTNFDAGFYLDHLFSVPTRFQPFRFFNSFAPFLFKSFRPMRKEPRSERNEIAEMHTTYSSVVASKAYWIKFLILNEYYFFEKQTFSKRMKSCNININKYFSIWKNKILQYLFPISYLFLSLFREEMREKLI